jgi:glycosyltransferase involved in cell wall biosynthesis
MQLCPPSDWGKLEIVPLGVDPTVFVPASTPTGESTFEVLCVGRLVPAKGQYILVEAMAELIRAERPVRLRLIGDGPDRAGLEATVRRYGLVEYIVFEGAVNQDRLCAFYAAASVFALASFAEGIPVVLMEAMAMGLPCISTSVAGIPELIRHGIDGLLVPPSDAPGLAQAIATLMDDPALRQRLACAGRQRVLDRFDLRHNVMRLADVFRQRLGESACMP